MKKPWSISTTVRNPERIRDFLQVLSHIDGEKWTRQNQKKYQVLLLQYKVYGYGVSQFLNNLLPEHLRLMETPEPITYEQAESILDAKNYVGGGDMRGRQSFNPLEKMGLAYIDENCLIRISSFGKDFLKEDYDLGNTFFRSYIKWQLPNPDSPKDFKKEDGYAIKPFIATLHLLKEVNRLSEEAGKNPVGISKHEFAIFVPTLINFNSIREVAQKIIDFRIGKETTKDKMTFFKSYHQRYISEFLDTDNVNIIERIVNNTKEYADNIIRYFRLTRYIHIRGNGFYVDLEPRRRIEVESLLASDDASPITFKNRLEYTRYLADITQPVLPWETESKLRSIVDALTQDVDNFARELSSKSIKISEFIYKDYSAMNTDSLKLYAEELRTYRRKLQDTKIHHDSKNTEKIKEYIDLLKNIYSTNKKRSIELERLATLALNALNDALEIKPNYPVGDDNEPTFTAPANKPDIECFYENFYSVCEVTMLTDRSQWYNEGQPVMRHVRDFENEHSNKDVYCLFVSPRIHQDTAETFWVSIKHGYKGAKQKIIPLSIPQFIRLLEILLELKKQGKFFEHKELLSLYNQIINLTETVNHSDEWIEKVPGTLSAWEESVLAGAK